MGLLTSPRFAGDERLERAANNHPPLMKREVSDAVKKLQQALVDLGFDMPISFAKGEPDGIYGDETARVVRQFQMDQGFPPAGWDGRAGHDTLIALDKLFQAAPLPPPPPPPPPQQAVVLRKSVWEMSQAEQQTYINAVNKMIAAGRYGEFVNFHRNMAFNMHAMGGAMPAGRMRFLPWHRIFVRKFEIELISKFGGAFVPYWDWNDTTQPGGIPSWMNAFDGIQVPLPAMSSAFPAKVITVTRDPGRDTPAEKAKLLRLAKDVGTILRADNFRLFTTRLEDEPHNSIHMWFGRNSTMGNVTESPSDPVFWTHHGEVDRIWTSWQKKFPGKNPTFTPPDNKPTDNVMDPFPPPNREEDFRDVSSQYSYSKLP